MLSLFQFPHEYIHPLTHVSVLIFVVPKSDRFMHYTVTRHRNNYEAEDQKFFKSLRTTSKF
jgi:hypothetical protein